MIGRKMNRDDDSLLPQNPRLGQLFWDSASGTMRKWNGKNWLTEVKPGEVSGKIFESDGENYD